MLEYPDEKINKIWKDKDISIKLKNENPKKNKKTKTYKRYEKYKIAKSIKEFIDLGGSKGDFKDIINTDYLEILNEEIEINTDLEKEISYEITNVIDVIDVEKEIMNDIIIKVEMENKLTMEEKREIYNVYKNYNEKFLKIIQKNAKDDLLFIINEILNEDKLDIENIINEYNNKLIEEKLNKEDINKEDIPKPILKWVGGKTQMIDMIINNFPRTMNNYHELFLGGGSVLISLLWASKNNYIKINKDIYAYDLNEALIYTYINIRDNKDELYNEIIEIKKIYESCESEPEVKNMKPKNEEEGISSKESYYFWIRKLYNELEDKRSLKASAYFIFMNKTGFRGMYREGPNGMNIPFGHYKINPEIINKEHLDEISELIKDVKFINLGFNESIKKVNSGDHIYLDSPYAPVDEKSFVGYTGDGFNLENHLELFNLTKKIGGYSTFMMSNADVDLVKNNISVNEYKYKYIDARRAINSKDPSSTAKEVIITNY